MNGPSAVGFRSNVYVVAFTRVKFATVAFPGRSAPAAIAVTGSENDSVTGKLVAAVSPSAAGANVATGATLSNDTSCPGGVAAARFGSPLNWPVAAPAMTAIPMSPSELPPTATESRSSQLYVRASPFGSDPTAVRANGVRSGIA